MSSLSQIQQALESSVTIYPIKRYNRMFKVSYQNTDTPDRKYKSGYIVLSPGKLTRHFPTYNLAAIYKATLVIGATDILKNGSQNAPSSAHKPLQATLNPKDL